MLSAPTRAAIGLLDVVNSPVELGQYIREARWMVDRGFPEFHLECDYLDVALSICYGRAGIEFDGFDAELTLESIATQHTTNAPRLSLLATYYHTILRLARAFPPDRQGLHIAGASLLEKLHDQFTRLVAWARELRQYELAGVCMSLAAECLWRAGGSVVDVISLASRSNMEFLTMDCEIVPGCRMVARQAANTPMLACVTMLPPPAPNYVDLLYQPGELLAV